VPRPSRNTDERLIRSAQALMKTSGLSQLNLRQVAAKAGVNLGMFHYHFKTKDQFIQAVLKDTYERFFENFSLKVEGAKEPLEKLRQALVTLGQFSRDNRHLTLSLMQDALNKDHNTVGFVRENMHRHASVVIGLIVQCQKNGSLQKAPLPAVMSYVMTATTGSTLALGMVEHLSHGPGFAKAFSDAVATDTAIVRRVNWVLAGLGPAKKPKSAP
jgi:AcrR family transcriptional regulator